LKKTDSLLLLNIDQIHIAYLRPLIPLEHGVDGLGKLSTVGFVDTTCDTLAELADASRSFLTLPRK
jgi:hypothetical protein